MPKPAWYLNRSPHRRLQAETTATITAYTTLAATARHAIVMAAAVRLISPDTAAAILHRWGLLPPMTGRAVALTLRVTYTGFYDTPARAAEQAPDHVAGKLLWTLPTAEITTTSAVTVTPAAVDHHDRFRVTVDTTLHLAVTVGSADDPAHATAIRIFAAVRDLHTAGLAVTGVRWSTIKRPLHHRVLRTADQPLPVRPIRALLTVRPRAGRDQAVTALHRLQHTIRRDTLRALTGGILNDDFQSAACRVDGFLTAAGLGRVPKVQRILVIADTTIRLRPTAGDDTTVDDLRPPAGAIGEYRLTCEADWTVGLAQPAGDGSWRIHWHHEFYLWLQPATHDSATDRVAAHLHRVLHDIDHDRPQIHIAGIAEVFDPFLDPETD